jgi:hypothetical protein
VLRFVLRLSEKERQSLRLQTIYERVAEEVELSLKSVKGTLEYLSKFQAIAEDI